MGALQTILQHNANAQKSTPDIVNEDKALLKSTPRVVDDDLQTLKTELRTFYHIHQPDKKLNSDVFEYYCGRRDELNEGLRRKYGIDLNGCEALWFPSEDAQKTERRRQIAANRIQM